MVVKIKKNPPSLVHKKKNVWIFFSLLSYCSFPRLPSPPPLENMAVDHQSSFQSPPTTPLSVSVCVLVTSNKPPIDERSTSDLKTINISCHGKNDFSPPPVPAPLPSYSSSSFCCTCLQSWKIYSCHWQPYTLKLWLLTFCILSGLTLIILYQILFWDLPFVPIFGVILLFVGIFGCCNVKTSSNVRYNKP